VSSLGERRGTCNPTVKVQVRRRPHSIAMRWATFDLTLTSVPTTNSVARTKPLDEHLSDAKGRRRSLQSGSAWAVRRWALLVRRRAVGSQGGSEWRGPAPRG
jgi:hypothetical protein